MSSQMNATLAKRPISFLNATVCIVITYLKVKRGYHNLQFKLFFLQLVNIVLYVVSAKICTRSIGEVANSSRRLAKS